MLGDFKYKGFISYSHQDERWARWLQRRLETYRVLPHLVGQSCDKGLIPKRLKPIFRDRDDLAAANSLGKKIEQALAGSENLLVICSPAAAKSHWVNQEILSFKHNNRNAQIFSLIVAGEPFASNMSGREAEECFPPALRFTVGAGRKLTHVPAEPLAADVRPLADGKRLGMLKVISGMIGVGLDEIVRRDMKRTRQRVTAITAGSLFVVLGMGILTGFALDARKEADARRSDAEGLIGFMLTDLRQKLEPVGRLDVLDDTALMSLDYYARRKNDVLTCEGTSTKARANYLRARISMDKKDFAKGQAQADVALLVMSESAQRCMGEPKFIVNFAHAQQWVVTPDLRILKEQTNDFSSGAARQKSEAILKQYVSSKATLAHLSKYTDWQLLQNLELSDADNLIGEIYLKQQRFAVANKHFDASLARLKLQMSQAEAASNEHLVDKLADTLAWRAKSHELAGEDEGALKLNLQSKLLYERLAVDNSGTVINWGARYSSLKRDFSRAEIYYKQQKFSAAKEIANKILLPARALAQHDLDNISWQRFRQKVEKFNNEKEQ